MFPAFAHGGPEVRTCTLINQLGSDFKHMVVALNGELSGRVRLGPNADVEFIRPPSQDVLRLARLLGRMHFDVLTTYGWGGTNAVLAARLTGTRRVIHVEDGFLPDEAVRQNRKRQLARRVILPLAATVVVPSETLRRIAEHTWRLRGRSITYIPNGIDTSRFSPATPQRRRDMRRSLGIDEHAVVVGTAGMLRIEKNHRKLLEAFSAVTRGPEQLLILGDGPEREPLERLAADLGIADRVILTGVVTDTSPYYAAMDVFALSSDTEQMPLVVLEAMASGLPIVATDVGDVRNMLSTENVQYVVSSDDDRRFASALAELIRLEHREILGSANRAKCENLFSLDGMVFAYRRLYQRFSPA